MPFLSLKLLRIFSLSLPLFDVCLPSSFTRCVSTNIALVRALRIWGAQRMYWHTLPNQDLCHILVKMSNFWKIFFAFSIVKGLSDYVVKILALKFEPKKSYDRKTKFSLCRNALIDPDLAKHKSKQKYVSTYRELLKQRPRCSNSAHVKDVNCSEL